MKIDVQKHPRMAAMADKLRSGGWGTADYRGRKAIVEPPKGWIKPILGFLQFSLRGLCKVQAVWKVVCAALNLRCMGPYARPEQAKLLVITLVWTQSNCPTQVKPLPP